MLSNLLKYQRFVFYSTRNNNIDYSKVPVIKENDLETKYVRGSGPGGQKVNTSSNAVFLRHAPTGLWVKVHDTRSVNQNYKIAVERLTTKLDNYLNGDESLEAQRRRLSEREIAVEKLKKQEELLTKAVAKLEKLKESAPKGEKLLEHHLKKVEEQEERIKKINEFIARLKLEEKAEEEIK